VDQGDLDFDSNIRQGRKGSVVAEQYVQGARIPKDGGAPPDDPPSNEELAKAVQHKVAAAVEMSRKYRHVGWYSAFVAAYMVVLWCQARSYKSGEVVQTLKQAFMPGGATTMTFQTENDVIDYLGNNILLPIWTDPVCGDGQCDYPWEFPSWGNFGCKADCGENPNVTSIVVNVRADFTNHPTITPRVLMTNAVWNLCLQDLARRQRGEADLCWYDSDQTFSEYQINAINSMSVIDGTWYVVVKGDYAGRVYGSIYDVTNSSNPLSIPTTPTWEACKLTRRTSLSATQLAARRLLQAYTQAHRVGGQEGDRILKEAVNNIRSMPELKHLKLGPLPPQDAHDSSKSSV